MPAELRRVKIFSSRELEILRLLAEGLDSKQIGEVLYLSTLTVRKHRQNMQIRHRCSNTAALISFAFRSGFLT
ncbi:response regulator transcription factor [Pedobacter paludis]|nr:LuxR C-terminal-related transcriptional regulator [Pedobacter paludis]